MGPKYQNELYYLFLQKADLFSQLMRDATAGRQQVTGRIRRHFTAPG